MLDNTITLAVDVENNGVTVDKVYTRFDTSNPNRTVYIGPDHQPDSKQTLTFYRSFPTKSGNFKGTMKSSVKITDDALVPSADGSANITVPVIFEVNFSIPIGVGDSKIMEMRQRFIAALDQDTLMRRLQVTQEI